MTKEVSYTPILDDYPNPFTTYDLGTASALVCCGYNILKIDKSNPKKALFFFENSDDLVECTKMYWKNQLQVDALQHWNTLKNLKNQIYS